MNALGIHGQRHIHPVIDDQRYLVALCDLMDLFRQLDVFPRTLFLFPQLTQGHTALQRLFHTKKEFFLRKACSVCNKIQTRIKLFHSSPHTNT